VYGAAFLHRVYGGVLRTAIVGSDARSPRKALMDDRGAADKTAGIVAVVAGLVIISESITIARMVVEASKAKE
jgi:hypothetical protein